MLHENLYTFVPGNIFIFHTIICFRDCCITFILACNAKAFLLGFKQINMKLFTNQIPWTLWQVPIMLVQTQRMLFFFTRAKKLATIYLPKKCVSREKKNANFWIHNKHVTSDSSSFRKLKMNRLKKKLCNSLTINMELLLNTYWACEKYAASNKSTCIFWQIHMQLPELWKTLSLTIWNVWDLDFAEKMREFGTIWNLDNPA